MKTVKGLNKLNFLVQGAAGKKTETRVALQNVRIEKDATWATNAHMLAMISRPEIEDSEIGEIPDFNFEEKQGGFYLTQEEIKKVIAVFPEKEKDEKPTQEKQSAFVQNNGARKIAVNHKGVATILHLLSQDLLEAPPTAKVLDTVSHAPLATVVLYAPYLRELASIIEKFSDDKYVTVEVRERETCVVFKSKNKTTEQEFTGLIMPIRI